MSYWLGIDVGSTFMAAAVCRQQPDGDAHLEVVSLGAKSDVVRSAVYLGTEGEVVVGDAAERRAGADPDRVVREFTQGIGEDGPIVIDGVEYSAAALTASVVSWVVDRVAQREGGPAHGITVTHPASWQAGKIGAMADALDAAGLPEVALCSGPQAAATSYSVREPLDIGATVAVYDLGGGTFDTAVVCKTGETTFSVLGVPEGIDGVGGTDFDDAVFGHVLAAVPAVSEPEPEATARMRRSYALCRRECTEAKEALSVDTEVTIPVLLPHVQSQVSMTRAEFDNLIRPQITETVDALRRTLASAGLGPADLDEVLVVGGSARIPLVADLLEAELGRPVVVDADPQVAMAVGAAMSGFAPGTAGIDDVTTEMDVHAATPALAPVGAPASPAPEPGPPESHVPPWLAATGLDVTGLDTTGLDDTGLDVEAPDPNWRPASSGRFARLAAAGLFGLVLAGGAVSAPFIMTSHGGTDSAPAEIPAPKIPAGLPVPAPKPPALVAPEAQLPLAQPPVGRPPAPDAAVATVAAIPAPDAGSGDDRNTLNADSTRGVATAPAAPNKPLNSAARSKAPSPPAPRTGANRSPAPAATTTAPPPNVPDWVTQARS